MDVFSYYPPAGSRYCEVEGSGDMDKNGNDSKVAVSKLHIGAEIGIKGIVDAAIKFVFEKANWKNKNNVSGDQGAAQASGDQGAAQVSGDRGAAQVSGDQGAAQASGDRGAATTTGDYASSAVTGKESVAVAIGYKSKAKGALGCWIVLSEWEKVSSEYHIKDVRSVRVDGETIKADTWYKLQDGQFVEAE